jgi:zinc transporter ZupT
MSDTVQVVEKQAGKFVSFCKKIWAKVKAFFAGIADFFKDADKRFSSGRLLKIAAGFLAGFLIFAAVFTKWIPADRLEIVLPYLKEAVVALFAYSGIIHISQNITKQ